jgi:hypothetical protein
MSSRSFLPFGDALRDFLVDARVSSSDLRDLVRKRGVFSAEEDKSSFVPILVRTGITPLELTELNENLKVREANLKRQTQSLNCVENSKSLLSVVPTDYDIREITKKDFSNYKILGKPTFSTIGNDQNNLELEFTIERYDHTQSWNKYSTQFSGAVQVQKQGDKLAINMSLSHTSDETKEVANKIVRDFEKRLKESGIVEKEATLTKILFRDFTNESRISFLQTLSRDHLTNSLYFKDMKDIGFSPDSETDLPDDISFLQDRVRNLVLQGKDLHLTVFIKNKALHKYIQMYRVEASYSFAYSDYEGTCIISFDFQDFIQKGANNSELIIKVLGLRFSKNEKNINKSKMKQLLLSQLENKKLELHKKLAQ